MIEKKPTIGIDRFIAKRWADYALDLRLSGCSPKQADEQLKEWLALEITGKEVIEKTASQLRRLWLKDDSLSDLRDSAIDAGLVHEESNRSILHYGLALNVFPFFRDLCITAGRLVQIQGHCQPKEVQHRLLEKYANPTTIERAVWRGFQTLEDWGLLVQSDHQVALRTFEIEDTQLACWFIQALMCGLPDQRMRLADLAHAPEKLGIGVQDDRLVVREAAEFSLERNGNNEDMVVFAKR